MVFPARGVALGPRCRSGIFTFRRRITAAAVGSLDCALTRLGQDERVQPCALLVVSTAILSKRPDRSTATLPARWCVTPPVEQPSGGRGWLGARLLSLPPSLPGDC